MCLVMLFFFFFSSRRRHTRFDCDWSSDVCSSDLPGAVHRTAVGLLVLRHHQPVAGGVHGQHRHRQAPGEDDVVRQVRHRGGGGADPGGPAERLQVRSEEHTSELQSQSNLVCRLLLEKKKIMTITFSLDTYLFTL